MSNNSDLLKQIQEGVKLRSVKASPAQAEAEPASLLGAVRSNPKALRMLQKAAGSQKSEPEGPEEGSDWGENDSKEDEVPSHIANTQIVRPQVEATTAKRQPAQASILNPTIVKPVVPKKSQLVLNAAEELLRQKLVPSNTPKSAVVGAIHTTIMPEPQDTPQLTEREKELKALRESGLVTRDKAARIAAQAAKTARINAASENHATAKKRKDALKLVTGDKERRIKAASKTEATIESAAADQLQAMDATIVTTMHPNATFIRHKGAAAIVDEAPLPPPPVIAQQTVEVQQAQTPQMSSASHQDNAEHPFYKAVKNNPKVRVEKTENSIIKDKVEEIQKLAIDLSTKTSALEDAPGFIKDPKTGIWSLNPNLTAEDRKKINGPIFMSRIDEKGNQIKDSDNKPVYDVLYYDKGKLDTTRSFIAPEGIPERSKSTIDEATRAQVITDLTKLRTLKAAAQEAAVPVVENRSAQTVKETPPPPLVRGGGARNP